MFQYALPIGKSWSAGDNILKFNHIGIPVTHRFDGEIDLPHLKMTVSDHENNPYGIQWMRFWEGAPYPELVKTVHHVAFVVDDLEAELKGKNIIIAPNSPSPGLTVAFIEVNGAPVELMEYCGSH
ncbi:VOC family protein [Endozoicomonas atrinae]|uniref:VOC family protein n=1 Tax=Endozoicomonas atrinae TaxID=1333660 RepID=UPI003B007DB9